MTLDSFGLRVLLCEDATGEDELDGRSGASKLSGAHGGVFGDRCGSLVEDSGGNGCALRGEHLGGESCDLLFRGVLDPGDQFFGIAQLKTSQNHVAEFWPISGLVVVGDECPQRRESNVVATAMIAEQMAPAAHLGDQALGAFAIGAGAGACEDDDPCRGELFRGLAKAGGGKGAFEIVTDTGWNLRPDFREKLPDSLAIVGASRPGDAHPNGCWIAKSGADSLEMRHEGLVG